MLSVKQEEQDLDLVCLYSTSSLKTQQFTCEHCSVRRLQYFNLKRELLLCKECAISLYLQTNVPVRLLMDPQAHLKDIKESTNIQIQKLFFELTQAKLKLQYIQNNFVSCLLENVSLERNEDSKSAEQIADFKKHLKDTYLSRKNHSQSLHNQIQRFFKKSRQLIKHQLLKLTFSFEKTDSLKLNLYLLNQYLFDSRPFAVSTFPDKLHLLVGGVHMLGLVDLITHSWKLLSIEFVVGGIDKYTEGRMVFCCNRKQDFFTLNTQTLQIQPIGKTTKVRFDCCKYFTVNSKYQIIATDRKKGLAFKLDTSLACSQVLNKLCLPEGAVECGEWTVVAESGGNRLVFFNKNNSQTKILKRLMGKPLSYPICIKIYNEKTLIFVESGTNSLVLLDLQDHEKGQRLQLINCRKIRGIEVVELGKIAVASQSLQKVVTYRYIHV